MNNKKIWICKSCIDDKFGRVGIKFDKDKISIFFPLGYNIPSDDFPNLQRKSVIDILSTMSLTKIKDFDDDYNNQVGNITGFPIHAYLWILNDYISNGLYNEKEKVYIQSQRGKTNWKRTFSTTPLFSNQGAIYLNPYVDKKRTIDNIITEIHALCINHSIEQIGWLFGDIEKIDYNYDDKNKNYYIQILNDELRKSFNDRKKTLLNNMIQIIKSEFENDSAESVNDILTTNYNHAWEKMVDSVFGNDLINNYRPELKWVNLPEKVSDPHMRPDTIIKRKNKRELFIIDSKYYKYAVIDNGKLPGAEDIDKQITYGDYCSNPHNFDKPLEYDTDKIYNAFIVPYNKTDNRFDLNENFVYIGYAESKARNNESSESSHKKIALLLMDTKFLIDCYLHKDKANTDKLVDSIIDGLNK